MTISYKWLCRHLPLTLAPEKLSTILTSIGLEVESMHTYGSIPGGLQGLVAGEVLTCEKHPGADKLKITTINVGTGETLQIICGAANVAAGQKVVVALVGTEIHPSGAEPFTIRKAKIRGEESAGMLCAEDEIGLGSSHDGIMVLDNNIAVGTPISSLYNAYEDIIYEIGLTPNRMDAMSHAGVARDVLAYINHHEKCNLELNQQELSHFPAMNTTGITVDVADKEACRRYSGVNLQNVTVQDSPQWLKDLLLAIGLQPINNVVDVTNFILHDTGQPLHAFDADTINGGMLKVQKLSADTAFTTLDSKERKLKGNELMICAADDSPLCMAGIYGGQGSGIQAGTQNIFLESAWFHPGVIRSASMSHGLRTDAATRFEKGVDISQTLIVLQQAVSLLQEVSGAKLSSNFIDVYPHPLEAAEINLKYDYLKKLSGKNYDEDTVKKILKSLGFSIKNETAVAVTVLAPLSKPDISIAADVVEEIMRIDGLDNIDIPAVISIAPSANTFDAGMQLQEKIANSLTGMGFNEIFTNSITDSKYYGKEKMPDHVHMLNNLSADLDVMRPQMLQTGLEVVAYNINRKNTDLRFYEIGKTYHQKEGNYREQKHLAIYLCGNIAEQSWSQKNKAADFYDLKAICTRVVELCGASKITFTAGEGNSFSLASDILAEGKKIGEAGELKSATLAGFGIKEKLFYADFDWSGLLALQQQQETKFEPLSRFPAVQRDLAFVVDSSISFGILKKAIDAAGVKELKKVKLFDIFESEKLGAGKKSLAVNFTFSDAGKTLEDGQIETMMQKILQQVEKATGASIRR